jgi:hypothetical protein
MTENYLRVYNEVFASGGTPQSTLSAGEANEVKRAAK